MKTIRTNALLLAQNLEAAALAAYEQKHTTESYYALVFAQTRAHRVAWMNSRAK